MPKIEKEKGFGDIREETFPEIKAELSLASQEHRTMVGSVHGIH